MKTIQVSKKNWTKISDIRRTYHAKNNDEVITALLEMYNKLPTDVTDGGFD